MSFNLPPPKCRFVEANRWNDRGWWCCQCTTHNDAHRSACRGCTHERCDAVVVTASDP